MIKHLVLIGGIAMISMSFAKNSDQFDRPTTQNLLIENQHSMNYPEDNDPNDQNGSGELTPKQVSEIKDLKRQLRAEMQAIGRDSRLSGYEKGQKKRAVSIKYQKKINTITGNKNHYDQYTEDRHERKYEKKLDALERRSDLTEEQRKTRKKALKADYKAEKARYKNSK